MSPFKGDPKKLKQNKQNKQKGTKTTNSLVTIED